jgi:Bovine immunodeficiency virus surface protein (SU)
MKQETVVNSEQVKGEHEVGKWMGAFMVLTGAIFLMGTSGITFAGHSPWMLVALLPVYWIGVTAYRCYKEEGRLTRRVFSIAVFGVLPFAYIAALALGYSVSGLWPLGIIAVGVSLLLFGGSK